MSTSSTLLAVSQALAVVNTLITLSGNEQRFRAMVSRAVAEGRTLSGDELNSLKDEAQGAVDRLGGML